MEKSCKKCVPKASFRSLFYFGKITKNSHCMQEILLKYDILKVDYQKPFKKLTFFSFQPSLFQTTKLSKTKGPGTSSYSLFRLLNKFTKMSLLVIYYLTKFDGVIQTSFWVIPKIISANLCKPIHDIINHSTSICPLSLESVE